MSTEHRAARRTLLVVIPLAGLGLVLATRTSFFYADDYLNFALARQNGLSLSFLKLSVFGELAPGHRLLDWLLGAHLVGLQWWIAIAILLLFWLGAVVAFERTAEELFESRWPVIIGTAFFATSPAYVRTIQWWANGEHVVPGLCGTLIAIAASLRWLRTRSAASLILAGVGYLGGLMFYTKPILVPLYVVGLAYLVPSQVPVRDGPLWRRIRADLPLLLLLAVITVLYVIAVSAGGYLAVPKQHVSVSTWLTYLRTSWLQGVTPLVIGQSGGWINAGVSPVVDALAQVVLVALIAVSLARSRQASRAWVFYVIAWAANAVLVGRGRLGPFGPGIPAWDPRYNAEMGFVLPLTVGLAFSAKPVRLPGRRYAVVLAGGAAAVAFTGSLAIAYARLSSDWPSGGARAWVSEVRASIAALRRRGVEPSVIDAVVPGSVEPGGAMPFDLLSDVLPQLDDRIVVDDQTGRDPPAIVAPNGTVRLAVRRTIAILHPSSVCARARRGIVRVEVRPRAPVSSPAGVLEVQLVSNLAPYGQVVVFFDHGQGYPIGSSKTWFLHAGDRVLHAELFGQPLVKARLSLIPHSALCIREVSVVDYTG